MKKIVILLTALFLGLSIQDSFAGQTGKKGKAMPLYEEEIEIDCDCAGELLTGTIWGNYVMNKNIMHYNVQGGTLTGMSSGITYKVVNTQNLFNVNIFRIIGPNGIVSQMTANYNNRNLSFECK